MKKFIKTVICTLFCAILLCTAVYAKTPDFTLSLGDDYSYFTDGDDLSVAAEITGLSVEEIEDIFKQDNLVMLAISEDKQRQVRVAYYENEVSEKIGDLSGMSTADIRTLTDELADDMALSTTAKVTCDTVEYADEQVQKYMTFSQTLTDSGGSYIVTQYLTVIDGAFWHITTYGPGSDSIPDVVSQFSVNSNTSYDLSKVFYAIGTAFAVFAIVMLVIFLRERAKESETSEITEE